MLATVMPNDVTVKDWLGTAAVAARATARECERMYDGKPTHSYPQALDYAINHAQQALEELATIRYVLEYPGQLPEDFKVKVAFSG